eukprot:6021982-Prymnesium_polylepis.1
MSARTRTAATELHVDRLASRSRALGRRSEYQSQRVQALKSSGSAADSRTAAEAADIIAQRAGRSDEGRGGRSSYYTC